MDALSVLLERGGAPGPIPRGWVKAMRMLMKARLSTDLANEAIKDGTMPKKMGAAIEPLHPEAAYFFGEEGERTAFIVFDMERSSQLPTVTETFFIDFGAKVEVKPVMNLDDVMGGMEELMARRSQAA